MAAEKKESKGISLVAVVSKEISRELSNEHAGRALLATTFKGLNETSMKQALMEGMLRGFKFKDFVEKNVYAIPFGGSGYSLVTSIDYARKVGMRSGVVGTKAPEYTLKEDGTIESCTVTVQKMTNGYVGDFTATVFFDEYNTKKNQWITRPRTMIAKVAEMHALRKACPEQLAKAYVEEEMHDNADVTGVIDVITPMMQETINKINDINELRNFYKENKGLGKAFDKAVTIRKAELEAKSASDGPADTGVVQGEESEADSQ